MSQKEFRQAKTALEAATEVLATKFYNFQPRWISKAAFSHLMINMKDLCQILAIHNTRISFKDDATTDRDVTDLISDMRNAICHIGSPLRRLGNHYRVTYCVAVGKSELTFGNLTLENPYDDDVAFFYGRHRILLNRHIRRARDEAAPIITKRFQDEGWWGG